MVGDSISEGAYADDYVTEGYVTALRKAFLKEAWHTNYGFVNLRDHSLYPRPPRQYHSLRAAGFTYFPEPALVGGSSLRSGYSRKRRLYERLFPPSLELSYVGMNFALHYRASKETVLEVTVDGTSRRIRLAATPARPGASPGTTKPFRTETYGRHTVRIRKRTPEPFELIGVSYLGADSRTALLDNYASSGLSLSDLDDEALRAYASRGDLVLAMGVNDLAHHKSLSQFSNKLELLSRALGSTQRLLVVDLIFTQEGAPYKELLKKATERRPNSLYIDLLPVSAAPGFFLHDRIHPSVLGHRIIGETLAGALGPWALSK